MFKRSWQIVVGTIVATMLIFGGQALARGGGGSSGGGHSSGGFSSGSGSHSSGGGFSSGSGSRSSGTSSWGGSTKSTPPSSWGSSTKSPAPSTWGSSTVTPKTTESTATWGSSSNKTAPSDMALGGRDATKATKSPTVSSADKAMYEKAKMSGTTYTSRDQAVKDFQTKNASKYNNSFNSEPTKRPEHIPSTTNVDGKSQTVIYSSQYGGYGYYNGSSWIMYNAMRDVAMMNMLMNQNHYYYGPVPVSSGPSFGSILMYILISIAVITAAVVMIRRWS